ncbi:MAG: Gfo/Idh/MocA family oxidoreductase [Panacibacter sp.]
MNTYKNVGLIECSDQKPVLQMSENSRLNGYNIKKVYINNKLSATEIKSQYPQAEIVADTKSIINDALIDLVVVSSPADTDMDIISEVLEAGKYIRVI